MYIRYFSRDITIHTVIYGADIRFWPTLLIYGVHIRFWPTLVATLLNSQLFRCWQPASIRSTPCTLEMQSPGFGHAKEVKFVRMESEPMSSSCESAIRVNAPRMSAIRWPCIDAGDGERAKQNNVLGYAC